MSTLLEDRMIERNPIVAEAWHSVKARYVDAMKAKTWEEVKRYNAIYINSLEMYCNQFLVVPLVPGTEDTAKWDNRRPKCSGSSSG
jgi:hypothetical protein